MNSLFKFLKLFFSPLFGINKEETEEKVKYMLVIGVWGIFIGGTATISDSMIDVDDDIKKFFPTRMIEIDVLISITYFITDFRFAFTW